MVPAGAPVGAVLLATFAVCALGAWKWRTPARLPPG
jgi:hypothetical protein